VVGELFTSEKWMKIDHSLKVDQQNGDNLFVIEMT
jgi:hypothetical protein